MSHIHGDPSLECTIWDCRYPKSRFLCGVKLTDGSRCVLPFGHEGEDHENENRVSLIRQPDPGDRYLSVRERMWLRHLLQMLSEQSRTVRDAVGPDRMVTCKAWTEQWAALKKELDEYTVKLNSGRGPVAVTKYLDHNE